VKFCANDYIHAKAAIVYIPGDYGHMPGSNASCWIQTLRSQLIWYVYFWISLVCIGLSIPNYCCDQISCFLTHVACVFLCQLRPLMMPRASEGTSARPPHQVFSSSASSSESSADRRSQRDSSLQIRLSYYPIILAVRRAGVCMLTIP
jgi:hypothetical protein